MLQLFYSLEKSPGYRLDRKMGVLVSTVWRREKSLALAENGTLAIQPVAHHYTN
jgi:hypothetical protein